jgi:hypothetical protein
MTTPFWSNDPTILFNKESILQIWPNQQMAFETKLNAISRLVIIMSILGFIFTRNFNLIIIGILTLAIIFTLYKLRKQIREISTFLNSSSIITSYSKHKNKNNNHNE